MTRKEARAAIKEIATEAGAAMEAAMVKLYEKMSEKEVAELSTFCFNLQPYRLAKTLLLAVAAETLDSEFNAETTKPGIRKAQRIAKIDRAPSPREDS